MGGPLPAVGLEPRAPPGCCRAPSKPFASGGIYVRFRGPPRPLATMLCTREGPPCPRGVRGTLCAARGAVGSLHRAWAAADVARRCPGASHGARSGPRLPDCLWARDLVWSPWRAPLSPVASQLRIRTHGRAAWGARCGVPPLCASRAPGRAATRGPFQVHRR